MEAMTVGDRPARDRPPGDRLAKALRAPVFLTDADRGNDDEETEELTGEALEVSRRLSALQTTLTDLIQSRDTLGSVASWLMLCVILDPPT